jgi:biofilm PGA synthesis N-glycosyltransferase PgaC
MQAFFWISVSLVFYTYIGYGVLLFLYNAIVKRKKTTDETFLPPVTFIVPAYNEEVIIAEKIENSLALVYPPDKISFVFITDGCSDKTAEIIKSYSRVKLLDEPERTGKSNAINRAMQVVQTPIAVFSDANFMVHPDSLQKLVRHYADKLVGGVSGEKRIKNKNNSAVSFGERLYWQYESFLKKAAADFYTLVGAAGELFSIRTHLYQPLNPAIILDDFFISANVCKQGHRFLYEKDAYGIETSSSSIEEERKRKIRISAGCFQALFLLKGLLNPFKNFRVAFQYFSHRVLRWTFCPLLLPLLFLVNCYLKDSSGLYMFLLCAQCLFYFIVLAGWLLSRRKGVPPVLLIPYYFIFMILSQYAGFYRFVRKKQTVFWEKAGRLRKF